jgi:hypothetical protein
MNRRSALAAATLATTVSASAAADIPSGNVAIDPSMLSFAYEPNPDVPDTTCVHALVDPLSQDWSVKCDDGSGHPVKFTVHLWLSVYASTQAPKKRYELLYWVTGDDGRHGEQTTWFNMAEPSQLASIETRVSLDVLASLRMALTLH